MTENASPDYFRRNENIHIHMSGEYPDLEGKAVLPSYFEIYYIISGEAVFEFGGSSHTAVKGDMMFINTDTEYSYHRSGNEKLMFYRLMFNHGILNRDKNASYPQKLLESSFAFYTLLDKTYHPYIYFDFSKASHSVFGEFFNKAYMEYKKAKNGYNDVLMAYLMLIIINAVRRKESLGSTDGSVYRKQAVAYVQSYINRCFRDYNLQVQGLADLVYLNPDYLGRIFKKETGHTITEAIQKKRIEMVCILLTTTSRPINDIARECGFSDMHFFYKVFKGRMGVLPGQYRENTKN